MTRTGHTGDSSADLPVLIRQAADLRRAGRRRDAIGHYRRILALKPDLPDYWFDLGYMLRHDGEFEAALDAYAEALRRGVSGPEEAHLNRAVIYSDELRRDAEAEAELRKALKLSPAYRPALANLGNLLEEQGKRPEAVAVYRQLLDLPVSGRGDPHAHLRVEALARLAHLQPPESGDAPALRQLETAAAEPGLDRVTRANAGFALGRARDALGLHAEAFSAFQAANRLARADGPAYDPARAEQAVQALMAAFPSPAAASPGAPANPGGPEPIFICGMFRSGSTLVEQVLSAHPQVAAGGELAFLPRLAAGRLAPFPASMQALTPADTNALADAYLDHLTELFPAAREGGRVTDKRPDNYLLIGLIKRLFPRAKIVHTLRHPLDNGLSVYFQHLDQRAMPYSSDLEAIGHHFGQYRRLMQHWKALWPDDIADFDYDAFVAGPEPALRSLLAFLGLDWHPDCLSPERRANTVKTASYWQVRQPLYRSASGRWQNYRTQIEPLRTALQAAGVTDAQR